MKSVYLLLVLAAATVSVVAAASNEAMQQPAGAALRQNSKDPAGEPSRNLDKKKDSMDDEGAVNADLVRDDHLCSSWFEDCDCGKHHYSPCCTGYGEKCMPGLTCVKYPRVVQPKPKAADDVEVVPAGDYSSPSGTCMRCGEYEGDPCCEGHKCDIGKKLTCGFDGYCESCGGPPETRCYYPTGEEEGKCERGEVDASGKCCYMHIEPCCDGECEPGLHHEPLVCSVDDKCIFCGRLDNPCCDGMKCDNSAYAYSKQLCRKGDDEEIGCKSPSPLVCTARGICEECGLEDQPCCQGMKDEVKCPGGSRSYVQGGYHPVNGLFCNAYGYCESPPTPPMPTRKPTPKPTPKPVTRRPTAAPVPKPKPTPRPTPKPTRY